MRDFIIWEPVLGSVVLTQFRAETAAEVAFQHYDGREPENGGHPVQLIERPFGHFVGDHDGRSHKGHVIYDVTSPHALAHVAMRWLNYSLGKFEIGESP